MYHSNSTGYQRQSVVQCCQLYYKQSSRHESKTMISIWIIFIGYIYRIDVTDPIYEICKMNTVNIQNKRQASIMKTIIKGYVCKDIDDTITTIIKLSINDQDKSLEHFIKSHLNLHICNHDVADYIPETTLVGVLIILVIYTFSNIRLVIFMLLKQLLYKYSYDKIIKQTLYY